MEGGSLGSNEALNTLLDIEVVTAEIWFVITLKFTPPDDSASSLQTASHTIIIQGIRFCSKLATK